MAPSGNSTVDIQKESEKADCVVQCVTESLTDILAGNIKLSVLSKCSNIKLTYVLYGRLLDLIKIQPMKTTETLLVILKFLYPDLVPFLPQRIASFSSSIRLYIERARKLGNVESIYQPISTLYAAKLEAEWKDFTIWGITKAMLITGPLIPLAGAKMSLANKHVIILCRLRNSYHLCWFKVVPKWLHFFGILNNKLLVKPFDIKRQWLQLVEQAEQLEGEELRIYLETPYQLPLPSKSSRTFNLEYLSDPISADSTVSSNGVTKETSSLADLPQNRCSSYCKESSRAQNLRQKVDELQLLLENKDRELTCSLSKLTEKEKKVEFLTLRLSKMKMLKNHWLMKYRKLAGANIFAEDSEFDVNLHAEKVKENTKCIRKTLNLGCSNESSKFMDKFLDDGFVEQLLECVIARGLNIDLSSSVVLMFLQELVIHSEKKLLNSLDSLQNGNLNIEPNVILNYNNLTPSANNDDILITGQIGSLSTFNSHVTNSSNCLNNPSFSSNDVFQKYLDVDESVNDKWSDLYEKTCEISQIDPKILSEATSGKNCQDGDWPPKGSDTSPIEILDNSSILLNAELFSKMALTKSDLVTNENLTDTSSYTTWDTEKTIAELSKNLESDYIVSVPLGSGFSSTPNDPTTVSDSEISTKSLFEMNTFKNLQRTFNHKPSVFKTKDYSEYDDIPAIVDIWSYSKHYKRSNNHHEEKNFFQSAEFNNNYIDITTDSDGTNDTEPKENSNREQDIGRKVSDLNKLHMGPELLSVKTTGLITDEISALCRDGFLSETSINTIKPKQFPLKDPANLKKRPRGRPRSLKRMKIQKTS